MCLLLGGQCTTVGWVLITSSFWGLVVDLLVLICLLRAVGLAPDTTGLTELFFVDIVGQDVFQQIVVCL